MIKILLNLRLWLIISIITIFFSQCVKDRFDFEKVSGTFKYQPNFAIPVANSKFTLTNMLETFNSGGFFVEGPDKLISIVYKNDLYSLSAEQAIELPDQTHTETFTDADINISEFNSTNKNIISRTIINPYIMSAGELVDSFTYKSGFFNVQITSSFLHSGQIKISFPKLKKNNIPYSKTININGSGNFSFLQSYSDLAGYTASLTNDTSCNLITSVVELTLNNSGNPINTGDEVVVNYSFTIQKFSNLFGYIGQPDLDIAIDTLYVQMFENSFMKDIYFENPRFTTIITNSYGAPIHLAFSQFGAMSEKDQPPFLITGSGVPSSINPLIVNYPSLSQLGMEVITQHDITKTNSNLPSAIALPSKYFVYNLDVTVNPAGITKNNFITDSSRIKAQLEVELPLWCYAKTSVLQDTMDFDFNDMFGDSDIIESLLLRINANNGIPLDAYPQIYVTDSNFIPIDSLINPSMLPVIKAATVGSNGRVSASTHKTTDITVNKSRFENYNNVKKMIINITLYTANGGNQLVKFYSDYTIEMQVSAQVKFNLTNKNTK